MALTPRGCGNASMCQARSADLDYCRGLGAPMAGDDDMRELIRGRRIADPDHRRSYLDHVPETRTLAPARAWRDEPVPSP